VLDKKKSKEKKFSDVVAVQQKAMWRVVVDPQIGT